MAVKYGFDPEKAITAFVSELPEDGVERDGIHYFVREDGFLWMWDETSGMSEKGFNALKDDFILENVAWHDFDRFAGLVPDWAEEDGMSIARHLSGEGEMPEVPEESQND